jgi:ribosome-binding protein aMBF1 (putative translation factor)
MEIFKKVAVWLKLKEHNLNAAELKFGEVKLETGETLLYDGDELKVGMPLMINANGEVIAAPDGKHMTVDGVTIVIEGGQGVVTEVIPKVDDAAPEMGEISESNPKVQEIAQNVAKREVERVIQEREKIFSDEKEKLKADYEKTISENEAKFKSEIEGLNKTVTEQKEKIEKFEAAPSKEPVQEKFGIKKKKSSWFMEAMKENKN